VFFRTFLSDEVDLQCTDFADGNSISSAQQFKENDIFEDKPIVRISKSEEFIPNAQIADIVLLKCFEKEFSLDIKALGFINNKSLFKHLKIIVNRLRTDFTPCAVEIVADLLCG